MEKRSPAEHFRAIATASEAYEREELSRLTIEEASRISEELLALTSLLDLPPPEPREFIPLARLVERQRKLRDSRSSQHPPGHDRDA